MSTTAFPSLVVHSAHSHVDPLDCWALNCHYCIFGLHGRLQYSMPLSTLIFLATSTQVEAEVLTRTAFLSCCCRATSGVDGARMELYFRISSIRALSRDHRGGCISCWFSACCYFKISHEQVEQRLITYLNGRPNQDSNLPRSFSLRNHLARNKQSLEPNAVSRTCWACRTV